MHNNNSSSQSIKLLPVVLPPVESEIFNCEKGPKNKTFVLKVLSLF